MIPVEYDDDFFFDLFKIVQQVFQGLVGFADKARVEFCIGISWVTLQRDLEFLAFVVGIVPAVVLHGDAVKEQGLFPVLELVDDVFEHFLVAHVVSDFFLLRVVFEEGRGFETEKRPDGFPGPALPMEWVRGEGFVAEPFEVSRHRVGGRLDVHLVDGNAVVEERHGIARQEFIFGIGRAAAIDGRKREPLDGVLVELFVKERVAKFRI